MPAGERATAEMDGGEPGPSVTSTRRVLQWVAVLVIAMLLVLVAWQVFFSGPDRSDWAYEMVQLDEANDRGYTGQGVRVGIVDTGIAADHPALRDADVVKWKDFVSDREDPYDDQGHGTAMACIIAGQGPLMGGAVDVKLIVAKVLSSDGESSDSRVADGIRFCVDPNGDGDHRDGADVISLSLGGRTRYIAQLIGTESKAAISEAVSVGVMVVAAAGNDGEVDDGEVSSPSVIREVVAVGAVDQDGKVASFSSRGGLNLLRQDPNKKPEVVAPGVDIVMAHHEGGYAVGSGTSQATAFVAACLAVALSAVPQYAKDGARGGNEAAVMAVKDALMDTCQPVAGQTLPHDSRAGYGIVQTMDLIDNLGSR